MSEVLEVKSPTKGKQTEAKAESLKVRQQVSSAYKVEPVDPLLYPSQPEHREQTEVSEDTTGFITEQDSINNTINMASLGPGVALKTAREEAKLSKEDIAKELRLAVRHIDHLEQDAYYKFSATAFYIGYIRSYAKLLELDPEKIIAKFYAIHKNAFDLPKHKITAVPSREKNVISDLHKTVSKTSQILAGFLKPKFLKIILVAVISISLLVWLFSTPDNLSVNNTSNLELASGSDTVVTELNPGDSAVTTLPPERVDELLPTSPVIVKNMDSFDDTALQNALALNENKEQADALTEAETDVNGTKKQKYG